MNAREIATALKLRRAGREFTGACPSCGYKTGFSVTQKQGKVLLCCHAGHCTQSELIASLKDDGLWPSERDRITTKRKAPVPNEKSATDNSVAALAILRRSRPLAGTLAETYLRRRGYRGAVPPSLRFASGKHPLDGQYHPMLVAAITDNQGATMAVHRTFLRADGRGKADLDPCKMTLGPIRGGAIRLGPIRSKIAVSEGIETALSYMQATGIPTWAAGSAGGIRGLDLPPDVVEVIIAADPDPVGLMAARSAARRWLREGRKVSIARPPLGSDFNDLAWGV